MAKRVDKTMKRQPPSTQNTATILKGAKVRRAISPKTLEQDRELLEEDMEAAEHSVQSDVHLGENIEEKTGAEKLRGSA